MRAASPWRAASVPVPSWRWWSSAQCIDRGAHRTGGGGRRRLGVRLEPGADLFARQRLHPRVDRAGDAELRRSRHANASCCAARDPGRCSLKRQAVDYDRSSNFEAVLDRRRRSRCADLSGTVGLVAADGCRAHATSHSSSEQRRHRSVAMTRAASRSLSPKRISRVATVSFSLTMGMMRSLWRRSMARWALEAVGRRSRGHPPSASTRPATIRNGRRASWYR